MAGAARPEDAGLSGGEGGAVEAWEDDCDEAVGLLPVPDPLERDGDGPTCTAAASSLEPTPAARVLLADPPWQFADRLGRRGASANYRCLSLAELKAFPLPPLADDCLLMLWRVAALQREALEVVEAWGFTMKTEIVWDKLTATGLPHFGLGRYVRASHEVCMLAVRGRVRVADRRVRSRFSAPVLEHSRKPDEMYAIAERLVPGGPFVELFARRRRAGWLSIGDELLPLTAAE